jgi:hypothetical protein
VTDVLPVVRVKVGATIETERVVVAVFPPPAAVIVSE